MSDKPFASRLKEEVDAFTELKHDRPRLAIVFILICFIVCIFFGIKWLLGTNKIKELESTVSTLKNENNEIKRDLRQAESEVTTLRGTVAPLINQAVKEFPGEEINEALRKIIDKLENEDPLKKPISSATSTIEIAIASDEEINMQYTDLKGGYLAFAKERDPILFTSGINYSAEQNGNGVVIYKGVFQMPATDLARGKPIAFLESAEYLQISFSIIPHNSIIIGGKAIVVINGFHDFEFQIPPQQMQVDLILVRGITGFMKAKM